MSDLEACTIARAQADAWVADSLRQGSEFSRQVLIWLSNFTRAMVISPNSGDLSLDNRSRGIRNSDANDAMDRLFSSAFAGRPSVVIVEDDLARSVDPHLPADVVLSDDRVLHWSAFDPKQASVSALLRQGSSGYPLNAFVLAPTAGSWLRQHRRLDTESIRRLSLEVNAVVVGVYDAESFVVLSR